MLSCCVIFAVMFITKINLDDSEYYNNTLISDSYFYIKSNSEVKKQNQRVLRLLYTYIILSRVLKTYIRWGEGDETKTMNYVLLTSHI